VERQPAIPPADFEELEPDYRTVPEPDLPPDEPGLLPMPPVQRGPVDTRPAVTPRHKPRFVPGEVVYERVVKPAIGYVGRRAEQAARAAAGDVRDLAMVGMGAMMGAGISLGTLALVKGAPAAGRAVLAGGKALVKGTEELGTRTYQGVLDVVDPFFPRVPGKWPKFGF